MSSCSRPPEPKVAVANGETLRSTPGHPLWVIEGDDLASRPRPEHITAAEAELRERSSRLPGRWVDAGDLRVGDVLFGRSGGPARVTRLDFFREQQPVYNFAVDELHCYAIGYGETLVDNSCFEGVEDLQRKYGDDYEKLYEVGEAYELRKARVPNTNVHHAPQSREAETLVNDWNRVNEVGREPAIRLPTLEHDAVSAAQRARGAMASARDLLASDIRILRQLTNAPNSSLQQLNDLSKRKHELTYIKWQSDLHLASSLTWATCLAIRRNVTKRSWICLDNTSFG